MVSWVGHFVKFDPVVVHRAKMEEKDFVDKIGVYDVVPRSDAAEKGCRVTSDDGPQIRARSVAIPWSLWRQTHFSERPHPVYIFVTVTCKEGNQSRVG